MTLNMKKILLCTLIVSALSVAGTVRAFDASPAAMMAMQAADQRANVFEKVSDKKLERAQSFIQKLGDEAISVIADPNLSPESRRDAFKALLTQNFDMNTIGRFTLGRYWRVADTEQQKEFLRLFRDMILNVYSKRFEEYSGQTMTAVGARYEGKRDIIVLSQVQSPSGGNPIKVDWRVRNRGSDARPDYKVIDVIVEGISMSLTQRSDFASVIERNGGQIQPLLVHLGG